jgi:hypothetical protein
VVGSHSTGQHVYWELDRFNDAAYVTQLMIHFSTRRFSYLVIICSVPPIIFVDVKGIAIVGEPALNHWREGRRSSFHLDVVRFEEGAEGELRRTRQISGHVRASASSSCSPLGSLS